MTIHFAGGEDCDFSKNGLASQLSVSTNDKRSFARVSLVCAATTANSNDTRWTAVLPVSVTSVWLTARISHGGAGTTNTYFLFGFNKAGVRRLGLVGSGTTGKLSIGKFDAAFTNTILATEAGSFTALTVYKYDIQVISFGASGTINVFRDGALIMTFTGDLTTNAITNLDGIALGNTGNFSAASFSEVICALTDTRSLGLVTLDPVANGNAYNWTNSFSSVSETILDDTTLIVGAINGDIAQFSIDNSRVGTVNTITGVVISGRLQRGSGIQNVQFGVRTGAVDYWSINQTLQTTLTTTQYFFTQNPATSTDWTQAAITNLGFNIGLKATT